MFIGREPEIRELKAGLGDALSGQGNAAPPSANEAPTAAPLNVFRRDGEYWTLAYVGDTFRLRESRGLTFLPDPRVPVEWEM